MKIWTLRHKPTGRFMPCRMFKQAGKGWTYWNPHEERPGYTPYDPNPRVFFTRQSALKAQAAWCAGVWAKGKSVEWGFESPEDTHPQPIAVGRNREDLEIVEGELVLS